MKYEIVVEKISESRYLAYCPVISNLWASGDSLDAALADLRRGFLCFLHDSEAEMDVIVRNRVRNTGDRPADGNYLA